MVFSLLTTPDPLFPAFTEETQIMTSAEIRNAFLEYFRQKEHHVVPSASLVPDDPTLLLTIAGMVPFKPVFLGHVEAQHKRVVTTQKCLRVNDIEQVGYTARHHTFFEMLGNFSFGDYFKKEACLWSWDFLTNHLKLDPVRMWTSVHREDQDAFDIWTSTVGVPKEKVVFLGDEDNFWSSGPVGPCGYCSEIYYDMGEERGCSDPHCRPGCECDRYLEVWNLVFMEFDRGSDGTLKELPKKNIDTGMGLERITSAVQGTESNFETDLFMPVIREIESLSGCRYSDTAVRHSFRIISDHIRGITMLLADGVYPGNEGRGYILRRLIRRAYRQGLKLSLDHPFLHELVYSISATMKEAFPELSEKEGYISRIVNQEETRFKETMQSGLEILEALVAKARKNGSQTVPGKEIFRLYDTHGFPVDIAREILSEEKLSYSEEECQEEMNRQQEQGRKAREGKARMLSKSKDTEELFDGLQSSFNGYHRYMGWGKIMAIAEDGHLKDTSTGGEEVLVVADRTPFYPEQGGQEWDTGTLVGAKGKIAISKVFTTGKNLIVHQGKVEEGRVSTGEMVRLSINPQRRRFMEIHHTVTHLLHKALRLTLGDTVRQAGSWVGEGGLRFDFTHFSPLTPEEIGRVEDEVNGKIFQDLSVQVSFSTIEKAQDFGVIALFDEKYEKKVRIIRIGTYTAELCGGTHLSHTSQAGLFTIVSESSIGAGLRRIEAMAGPHAYKRLKVAYTATEHLRREYQVEPESMEELFKSLHEENRQLKKARKKYEIDRAIYQIRERIEKAGLSENSLLAHLFETEEKEDFLKELVDKVRPQLKKTVFLVGTTDGKTIRGVLAAVGMDASVHLGKLIREILKTTGGGGGGKPDLSQFGGLPHGEWGTLVSELGARLSCRIIE